MMLLFTLCSYQCMIIYCLFTIISIDGISGTYMSHLRASMVSKTHNFMNNNNVASVHRMHILHDGPHLDTDYESGQGIVTYPNYDWTVQQGYSADQIVPKKDISFHDLINIWISAHPNEYSSWLGAGRVKYKGGYYIDTNQVNICPPIPSYTRNPYNQTYGPPSDTTVPPTASSSSTGYVPPTASSSSTGYVPPTASSSSTGYVPPTYSSSSTGSAVPPIYSSTGVAGPIGLNDLNDVQDVYGNARDTAWSWFQQLFQVWNYNLITSAAGGYTSPPPHYLPTHEPYVAAPPALATPPSMVSQCVYPAYESNYESWYLPNGYCIYGYDEQGYDPFGYDATGYDRNGWSRYGYETYSHFNVHGKFANSSYADLHVIFDTYGKPLTTVEGEILRYDIYGYDQYGYDQWANPRPRHISTSATTNAGNRTIPLRFIALANTGSTLTCERESEVLEDARRLYLRKSVAQMNLDDWERFRNAWNILNDNGVVARFVLLHSQPLQQYGTNKFLPWHREFLARFEYELHKVDHCVFLPYWDVTAMPILPHGIATSDFPPAVKFLNSSSNVLLATSDVSRSVGKTHYLPNSGLLLYVIGTQTFTTFTQRVEQFLNAIHVYMGGDMNFVSTSPKDPAFWLAHAFVDHLWAQWQIEHPTEPTPDVITSTINPLSFGGEDSKGYQSQTNIEALLTPGAAGYRYI